MSALSHRRLFVTPLVIGTRGSKLALTQTHWVAARLQDAHPDLTLDIRTIQTRGDQTQAANVPLSSFGEKGVFAKELETALLTGEIDLAVHSMKDLAHTLPDGLVIAAVPEREDPRDCLIGTTLDALPQGARVGTGSVRRRALLWSKRPDLKCLEIRGNIDTRLRKWREGEYDAICLAVAGLNRLGLQDNITEILDSDWFTPDPGQGALAIEIREHDRRVLDTVLVTDHPQSNFVVRAERAFLRSLGGGCQTPLGALAVYTSRMRAIVGMVASPDGTRVLKKRHVFHGHIDAEELGHSVADKLRAAGAGRLLQSADAWP
jgi:hydroxymethylbilane synthase